MRSGCHVLVIDDDPSVAGLIASTLEEDGMRASIAHDGVSGLLNQDHDPADVVMLDLRLADMHGSDVIFQLRCIRPDLPIVVITGFPGDALRIGAPVADVLYKPLRLTDIRTIGQRYCIGRQADPDGPPAG
jgi:DNA-binding response OmpR family regulator